MGNVIPVVFCFDKRIILGASVAIKSLIDCAKDSTTYDIRIFHSDLSLENQKNLCKLTENSRHNLAFHYINPEIFKGAPHNNHSWTELVYYRLLVPEILKEYDKVVYSDVDVLFKEDLEDLYFTDIGNNVMGMVRAEKNTADAKGHKYFSENIKDYIYWTGLILFNCNLYRQNNTLEKLQSNIKIHFEDLKAYDLDLVNITCQEVADLDFKYCVLQSIAYNSDYKNAEEYEYLQYVYSNEEIQNAKSNPAIIHYAGKAGKPWRMKKPYSDYQQYINMLPKELKQYTMRDIRKKLFNKFNTGIRHNK